MIRDNDIESIVREIAECRRCKKPPKEIRVVRDRLGDIRVVATCHGAEDWRSVNMHRLAFDAYAVVNELGYFFLPKPPPILALMFKRGIARRTARLAA